jgi:hypothetical protein
MMGKQNIALDYIANGDYFIPNIVLSVAATDKPIGKYGRMRQEYIQKHRPGFYNRLLLSEKLQEHLVEIDQAARQRLDMMMPKLAQDAGATEGLKARDPMKWVGLMNACKARAEEIIFSELIFD